MREAQGEVQKCDGNFEFNGRGWRHCFTSKTFFMEQNDINRTNMINTVIQFSDANPAPTAGMPAWAAALTGLKAKMVLVNTYNQLGKASTSGVTTDIGVLRETMTEMALKCANATKGYANSVSDNTLKAQVDYVKSELDDEAKEDIDDVCQQIHDATNANIAGAGNFGITPVDVTDLQSAITAYRAASQGTRQAIVNRSQANQQVTTLVREAIDTYLIGQMDPMVNTLKISNNAHWLAWRQAREIINLGSTTAKVRGQVTRDNGMFLSNVSFTIYEAGTDSVVKQVITDAEGKFSAAQLAAGDYDFRWELDGYMTVNETNVQIAAGKELKRKIVMHEGGGSATLTGDVAAGAIANINVMGIEVREETTIRLKVTGNTLRFYAATGNMEPPGTQYLDVLPGQIIQKTVIQFASMVGFDEELEDFLNVQNNGAVPGHWEMRFENLGS